MGNFKEEARDYQFPGTLKNIADLSSVSVELVIFNEDEAEFPYKYVEIDNVRYKVPLSVIGNLKAILEDNPNIKTFKVKKIGEGKDTRYTVIPLS